MHRAPLSHFHTGPPGSTYPIFLHPENSGFTGRQISISDDFCGVVTYFQRHLTHLQAILLVMVVMVGFLQTLRLTVSEKSHRRCAW